MKKIFISIPEDSIEEYSLMRIKDNYRGLLIMGGVALAVQLYIIFVGFMKPSIEEAEIWQIYKNVYIVFTLLNIMLLSLMSFLYKKSKTSSSILNGIMALYLATLHFWAMGVGIADQFQHQDIVVYYVSMFIISILMNISVKEYLALLLVVYCGFVLIIISNVHLLEFHQSVISTTAQFIFFSTIIRYHIDELKKKNFIQHYKLSSLNSELEFFSYHDHLTGVLNRRRFEKLYESDYEKSVVYQKKLGILLIDIDYFKQFNDTYGHVEGDKALKVVGELLEEVFENDSVYICRYGGDEFIICTRDLPKVKIDIRIEEINEGLKCLNIDNEASKSEEKLTISIGMNYAVPLEELGHWKFVEEADRHLYIEKAARKDKLSG